MLIIGNATPYPEVFSTVRLAADRCGCQVRHITDISEATLPAADDGPRLIVWLPSSDAISGGGPAFDATHVPWIVVTHADMPESQPNKWPDTVIQIRKQELRTLRTSVHALLNMAQRHSLLQQQNNELAGSTDQLRLKIQAQEQIEQELRESLERAHRARRALLSVMEDNRRITERLAREEKRLRSVLSVLQSDLASPEELLRHALSTTVELTESQFGCVGLVENGQTGLGQIIWAGTHPEDQPSEASQRLANTLCAQALANRQPVMVNHYSAISTDPQLPSLAIHRYIAAPVCSHGHVAAIACIVNSANDYDESDVLLLTLMLDTVWRLVEVKRNEVALRHSESMYRAITENAFDLIALIDDEGCVAYANKSFTDILGYRTSEVIGVNAFQYLLDTDRNRVLEKYEDLMHHRISSVQSEVRVQDASQQIRWLDCRAALIASEDHLAAPLMIMARDVTSRKQAEQERERLMSAIEQAAEMVIITSAQGIIEYVNPAYETISGHAAEDVIGRNVRSIHGQIESATLHELLVTILSGQAWRGSVQCLRKDRRHYTVEATISPVRGSDGTIINYVLVGHDVTEREQLQRQIGQAQRMEAIGRLAGGVAHDFNNMLSVIQGFSELALDHLHSPYDVEADLAEISNACERASQITRQLLSFAKQSTRQPQVLDLNATLEGMLKMLRRLIGEETSSWSGGHHPVCGRF